MGKVTTGTLQAPVLHCSTRPMVEIANLDGDDDDDDGVIVQDVSASKPRRRRPAVPPSVKKPKKPSRGAGDEEGGKFKISWLHVAFLLLFVAPTLFAVADYFFGLTPPPGQDFTHVSDEARMYKMKIKALYEDYNPEKLKEIPRLMQKYRGRERALYRAIQKKCTLRVCVSFACSVRQFVLQVVLARY
jgi:hypothetical protein